MDENAIADCFDHEVACCTPKALRKKRARKRLLANAIETTGIAGLGVLEIGSGVGELTRELVRRGAASATGIDLSPQSVAIATAAARDEGLAERVFFKVGNGASQPLEPYDVVVLDRVICCYPNAQELVPHTAAAARLRVRAAAQRGSPPDLLEGAVRYRERLSRAEGEAFPPTCMTLT